MIFNKRKTTPKSSEKRKAFSLVEISVVILIIGILIAGISQASDMIDEGALKAARTATNGSRVSRVRDLVLWLDATEDGASLTSANKQAAEGDDVAKWKDFNPNSINGFELTASGTPKYNANKTGGLPGIYFNGTNSYLKIASKFDSSAVNYTIYLVYQPVSIPASGSSVIVEKRSATSSFPYKLELESNGYYKLSDSDGTARSVYGAKKASTGKVNLIRLSRSSSGTLTIAVDDVSASGTGGTGVNSDELIIGAQNAATPSNFANGRIGELIIYERDLAISERSDIETYLYKKWKIEKDSTKAGVCSTSAVTNSAGTMAVGTGITVPCAPGYSASGTANCSAAPNLVFSNLGSATCTKSSCIATASDKIATGSIVPSGATCASVSITKCKDGTTTPTTCSCTAGSLLFNIVGCP